MPTARRQVESNADASFRTAKAVEAQDAVVKSHLAATEIELENLRSKQAEAEERIKEVVEKSKVETREVVGKFKDAQFEATEALYLQQVEQIKVIVFKRGYDVALEDAGVPKDSPLWNKYTSILEQAPPEPLPVEPQSNVQAGDAIPSTGGDRGETFAAEPPPSISDIPK